MKELNWINIARQFIGLREVKGTKHNPAIIQMLNQLQDLLFYMEFNTYVIETSIIFKVS